MASRVESRALIGSSPMALMEAIWQSMRGRKVTVFEAKPYVGGAWAGTTVCGISGVDIGSHDQGFPKRFADFFQEKFGIRFQKMDYDPRPEEHSLAYLISDQFLPEGGCAKLSEKLAEVAKRCGVVIKTNCEVESLSIFDYHCELKCKGQDESVKVDQVIKTTCTALDVWQRGRLISKSIPKKKNHVYLVVKDQGCPRAYILPRGSEYWRISNLTSLVKIDPSHRLFVAELNEGDEDGSARKAQKIMTELKRKEFLSKEAELVRFEANTYTFKYMELSEKVSPDVFVELDSADITSLRRYFDGWDEAAERKVV